MSNNTNPTLDVSSASTNLIGSVTNLIQNVVNQYIVKPTTGNYSGFVFDVIGDEEISIDSEITDHYVEDNTSIQDHITLRPEKFSVKGYVGELTDILQSSQLQVLTQIQTLGTLGGLNPSFAAQAQQAYNQVTSVTSEVTQAYNQAQNFFNVFSQSNTSSTKQQQAWSFFYSLWLSRTLFTVQTPFNVFYNMAIESLRATQRDDNKIISDFIVTFKKIRKVTTQVVGVSQASNGIIDSTYQQVANGRYADMTTMTNPYNAGTIQGQSTDANGNMFSPLTLGNTF